MQLGIMEIDAFQFGPIARAAAMFAGLGLLFLIYMIAVMLYQYGFIRRRIRALAEPILAQIGKDVWEPSALIFQDAGDPWLSVYAEALRQDLSGRGSIAVIESLDKIFGLLAGRFKQMIHYSRLLGWSICFAGFVGALSHLKRSLDAMLLKSGPILAATIAHAIMLLVVILLIGSIGLAASFLSQGCLSSLSLRISNQVLRAAGKKPASPS